MAVSGLGEVGLGFQAQVRVRLYLGSVVQFICTFLGFKVMGMDGLVLMRGFRLRLGSCCT